MTDARTPSRSSPRGKLVVTAMVVVGLVAVAGLGRFYWARVAEKKPDAAAEAQRAEKEHADLLVQVTVALANRQAGVVAPDVEKLVQRYPDFAPARTTWAKVLLAQQKMDQAYEQFKVSLKLDPRQADVHFLTGTLAMQMKKLDEAGQHYSQAVGLAPERAEFRVHLAQVYIEANQPEKARRLLLEAIQRDSTLHEAYASLSDLYAQRNELTLALPQIDKAIECTPPTERGKQVIYVRRKARLLLRDGQAEAALQTLRGLTKTEQRDPAVMAEMANCWAGLNRPAEAAAMYEKALEEDLAEWRWAAGAAQWRLKAGDKAGARRLLNVLRSINPRAPAVQEIEEALKK